MVGDSVAVPCTMEAVYGGISYNQTVDLAGCDWHS